MIASYFLLIVFVISYIVRIFELPLLAAEGSKTFEALENYFNAFYMTFITITTVGYGDITPKTI